MAAVAAVGLYLVADAFFLPEASSEGAGHTDFETEDVEALKAGAFEGADSAHHVSGTVQVLRVADAHYLRFQDYEQTQGPDVYIYLTPAADPDSTSEVEGQGLRVLVEGGADGGESTVEGDFDQRLPEGFDPTRYQGVAVWCDQFNVLFGSATLQPA